MRTRILNATMLATAVFSGLTFAQIPKTEEDHSAHHPSAGAPAASTTVPVTSAAPVTETSNQQLKTMQEMHKKMQVAKDPAGRNKLMSEHMKLMQSGMTMMGQMRGDQRTPLVFMGAARSLREQALPLNFQVQSPELLGLAVGQPVKVYVQSKQKTQGIAVPQSALMKNAANQNVVWVKSAAEQFEPRTVTFEPLDGARVTVISGLKSGDRVATQGATLINQVR